ncbi:unnamed protein product [Scytosiphon promiscuus]
MAPTDRDVLVALYNATDGPNWKNSSNWNTDAELSEWHGVTLNGEGRVEALWLNSHGLRGPIPKELGALSKLEQLYLQSNGLTGPIPPELGKLGALRCLYLSGNYLSGPIPPELGKLTSLKQLQLQFNQLTGHIPRQLGDLGALEDLHLRYNTLEGSIPPELGKLAALELLELQGNELSGAIPAQLGALNKLRQLDLSNNQLSGFARAAAEGFAARNVTVETMRNPWKEPPANVMAKGMAQAALFLRDLDDYGRTWSNRLKVILVGLGEAGKTSIATGLENRSGGGCPKPEERTVGVEIKDIKLGPGPVGEIGSNVELDVSLWDFAGQRAYYDTHQMFLTTDALFVLVVDLFAYSTKLSREDALDQWLDILQSRVPGSIVLLVGTHSDVFRDSDEFSARKLSFNRDVEETIHRIRSECDRAETELGNEHPDVQGRRYRPIRVVKTAEVLALDVNSSEGQDLLKTRIEHLAYNGYEGYTFPSVRCVVPEPYLPAIATLEAVRRGADLRGSGRTREAVAHRLGEGDPKKRRSFIRFSEALSLFVEQQSMFTRFSRRVSRKEEERVFLDAIKMQEAHGAILLTQADGGGGAQKQLGAGAVSAVKLIIHVDSSRFADLVRRVVDIRLVDPQQQTKVVDAMEAIPSMRSQLLSLTDQHKRFVEIGEVSKEYLKFLWLRDMKLDEASRAAPPLKMTDEDIDVMVGSLLDVRFMFRVRDGDHAFVPDRYIVASCLSNKAGPEVDPGKILKLKPGCEIHSQKLKLVGANALPPGLIPRLLAWCGRGEARIEACWKRGVCFAFKNQMVLLYELRGGGGTSWIECLARGNMHDESARTALKEVGDELGRLIGDSKYGFPGLGLTRSGESWETSASSDGDHKALVERIEVVLKDQMNVKFMADKSLREDVASIRWPIPRLMCVLPAPERGEKPLDERDRSFPEWSGVLRQWCEAGKKKGRGFATRKLRLFFVCAQDMSLAECGPEGQGYEVSNMLTWAKKARPFAKMGLVLASIALRVCTSMAIPTTDFEAALGTQAGGALSEFVEEALTSGIEATARVAGEGLEGVGPAEGLHLGGAGSGIQQVRLTPLQGFAYCQLEKFVQKFEVEGTKKGKSHFPSFGKAMRLADRGGRGVEWAWVRNRNVNQFRSS